MRWLARVLPLPLAAARTCLMPALPGSRQRVRESASKDGSMLQHPRWIAEGVAHVQQRQGLDWIHNIMGEAFPLMAGMTAGAVVPGLHWAHERRGVENFREANTFQVGRALMPDEQDIELWVTRLLHAAATAGDLETAGSPNRTAVVEWSPGHPRYYYPAGHQRLFALAWWPQHVPRVMLRFDVQTEMQRIKTEAFIERLLLRRDQLLAKLGDSAGRIGQVMRAKFVQDIDHFIDQETKLRVSMRELARSRLERHLQDHPPSGCTEADILGPERSKSVSDWQRIWRKLERVLDAESDEEVIDDGETAADAPTKTTII